MSLNPNSDSSSYLAIVKQGTLASRETTPVYGGGLLPCVYYATDTGAFYVWNPTTAAWVLHGAVQAVVNTAITASTTQTRAGATQMTGTYNNITVCANAGDAVGLPPITAIGQQCVVTNAGAAAAAVFPDNGTPGASTTIDGGSAAASKTLTNVKSALFTATTLTNWQTIGSAARVA